MMKVKVESKDVGVGENDAKACVVWEYFLARLRTKLWRGCLWIRGSCLACNIEFELVVKTWARKKD
jgi:hypothetical protein